MLACTLKLAPVTVTAPPGVTAAGETEICGTVRASIWLTFVDRLIPRLWLVKLPLSEPNVISGDSLPGGVPGRDRAASPASVARRLTASRSPNPDSRTAFV